jgi:hypothetical protein
MQRVCLNEVEDEPHFLLECQLYIQERPKLSPKLVLLINEESWLAFGHYAPQPPHKRLVVTFATEYLLGQKFSYPLTQLMMSHDVSHVKIIEHLGLYIWSFQIH